MVLLLYVRGHDRPVVPLAVGEVIFACYRRASRSDHELFVPSDHSVPYWVAAWQGTFISWDPTRAPGYRNISKHEFRLGTGARTVLPGHDPKLQVLFFGV